MSRPHEKQRWRRALSMGAAGLALAAVFALYFQPDLVVDLTTRLWSCF